LGFTVSCTSIEKAETVEILTDTGVIGALGAGLTALATQASVNTIDGNVDSILADTGTDGVVVASGSKTGYALSAAGVDAVLDEVVEGSMTFRQMLTIFLSGLGGISAGGGTATITFADKANTKARITATVDGSGNRTAVVLDGT